MSVTYITNNPTRCEVMTDGKKCGELSAFLFVNAFTKQLMCDGCAMRQRAAGVRGPVPGGGPPIMEFSLLELIPARQALLDEKMALENRLGRSIQREVDLDKRLTKAQWHYWIVFACACSLAITTVIGWVR
jgi:hypothetical protein